MNKRNAEAMETAKLWQPQVMMALKRRKEKHHEQPNCVSLTFHKLISAQQKFGFERDSWPNETNEPHLTGVGNLRPGPVSYANTNYVWSPKPGVAIPELQAHIAKLRLWRTELANECDYLWTWLAAAEAEYYGLDAALDSHQKLTKRRYLEVLGNMHAKVWIEVSKCNWKITDSQKRIEQLRSASTSNNGEVTWRPPSRATASAANLDLSIAMLERYVKLVKIRRTLFEAGMINAADPVAYPDLQFHGGKIQNPLNGKLVDVKDVKPALLERLEQKSKNLVVDEEALDRLLMDGIERIKKAQKREG